MADENETGGPGALHLPLYGAPEPLAASRHSGLALKRSETPYSFARDTSIVPITVDEFELAMLAYPIVLIGAARQAAVVVGLEPSCNLFVSEQGAYAPGLYVPGYLRCHPFGLGVGDGGELVVFVDGASDRLVPLGTSDSDPLFDGDQPSAAVQAVIAHCVRYAAAEERTAEFVRLAEANGLLEARQAHFRPRLDDGSHGEPELLLDYQTVSRPRLDALEAAALAALRDGGGLAPAFAQVFSEVNWNVLTLWAA